MTARRLVILLAVATVAAAASLAAVPRPETPDERVSRISAELRCPVCQGQPVADSPSATAREMRDLVARRVAEGRSDDEIRDEFRRAYGEWVFLAPPLAEGRAWIWALPVLAILGGLAVVILRLRDPMAPPPEPGERAGPPGRDAGDRR